MGFFAMGFRPVNDKCLDCNKSMSKNERQEMAWDKDGDCRRRCDSCIIKAAQKKAEAENTYASGLKQI